MSTTLHHYVPSVNPTAADIALGDRLAYLADGGDLDTYTGPGWDVLEPFHPSLAESMFDSGYSIGLEGAYVTVRDAFPHHSPAAIAEGGLSFTMGREAGRREHARRAGYALGVAGQFCEQPGSISVRFAPQFEAGWQAGAAEWDAREAVMAEWDAEADTLASLHDAEIAEAGGWYRSVRI